MDSVPIHRVLGAPQNAPPLPLSASDVATAYSGMPLLFAFDRPLDEQRLIASLERLLSWNPYLAGRIVDAHGTRPAIHVAGGGLLLTIARYDNSIPAYGVERPLSRESSPFIHDIFASAFDAFTPLVQVKLSNFKNGSLLCFTISHPLCDGCSVFQVLRAWTAIAAGREPEPAIFDRTPLMGNPAQVHPVESSEPAAEPVVYVGEPFAFRLTADWLSRHIAESKRELTSGLAVTEQDIVMATVLQLTLSSTRIQPGNPVYFGFMLNARPQLGLADGFFGNAVDGFQIVASKLRYGNCPTAAIATELRQARQQVTTARIVENFGRLQALMLEGKLKRFTERSAAEFRAQKHFVLNNLTRFPVYDLDLGAGSVRWFDIDAACLARNKMVAICPTPQQDGGIDVRLCLRVEEALALSELLLRRGLTAYSPALAAL